MKQRVSFSFHVIQERFSRWVKASTTSLLIRTFVEVVSTSWFLCALQYKREKMKVYTISAKKSTRPCSNSPQYPRNSCTGFAGSFTSLKVAVFITGFCLAALDCFDERRDKGSYHFFVPFPREAESREETHPSEKLLCLSHVRIACSSCWDVDEDTGCETGQQEVTGKLSQIRQLNPLSLYDHMWWS